MGSDIERSSQKSEKPNLGSCCYEQQLGIYVLDPLPILTWVKFLGMLDTLKIMLSI